MLGHSAIGEAAIGEVLGAVVAPPDPDPAPDGVNAIDIPAPRKVIFSGGTRVVTFDGGTRTVRF